MLLGVLRILLILASATSVSAYISIITGASGFVGRHVAYSLLHNHYNDPTEQVIVCLVRQDKVSYEESYWLAHVEEFQQKYQHETGCYVLVLPYDMLDNGETLMNAMEVAIEKSSTKDCPLCIYHIASVFGPTPDPIRTAKDNVKSAECVIMMLDKFGERHPHTKPRVVVTSSMASVRATDQTPLNGKFYTHRDWNTISKLCENWGSCYQWSKAESERKSWELVRKCNEKYANEETMLRRRIEMVALCPSFVFGPIAPMPTKMKNLTKAATSSSSYSLTLISQWLRGESPVQSRLCVDVRDVAKAHLAAGTKSNLPSDDIDRRYILSTERRLSSEATAQALMKGVRGAFNNNPGSVDIFVREIICDTQFTGGAIKIGEREVEASERLERDLGVVCRPVEKTMQDMAEAILSLKSFQPS
jgi:nucleoside-diphosphate-sugar epimerase